MARYRSGEAAKWLAMAGAVEGISSALIQRSKDRREESLEQIRMQYLANQKAADRKLTLADRANERTYNAERDATKQENAIALLNRQHELGNEFNWNDPNNIKSFSNVAEAKAAKDPTLLQPRMAASDKDMPADIRSAKAYQEAGPEFQEVYDRINKISQTEQVTTKELATQAFKIKEAFMKADRYDRPAIAEILGIPKDASGKQLDQAIMDSVARTIGAAAKYTETENAPSGGAIGLMNSDPVLPPDGPQLNDLPPPQEQSMMQQSPQSMGVPGASRDNPADASQFSERPPVGTWVRLSDGRVIQIPQGGAQ